MQQTSPTHENPPEVARERRPYLKPELVEVGLWSNITRQCTVLGTIDGGGPDVGEC